MVFSGCRGICCKGEDREAFWARIRGEQVGIRGGKEEDCGFARVVDVVKTGRPEIGGVITRRDIDLSRYLLRFSKFVIHNIFPLSPLLINTTPITSIAETQNETVEASRKETPQKSRFSQRT